MAQRTPQFGRSGRATPADELTLESCGHGPPAAADAGGGGRRGGFVSGIPAGRSLHETFVRAAAASAAPSGSPHAATGVPPPSAGPSHHCGIAAAAGRMLRQDSSDIAAGVPHEALQQKHEHQQQPPQRQTDSQLVGRPFGVPASHNIRWISGKKETLSAANISLVAPHFGSSVEAASQHDMWPPSHGCSAEVSRQSPDMEMEQGRRRGLREECNGNRENDESAMVQQLKQEVVSKDQEIAQLRAMCQEQAVRLQDFRSASSAEMDALRRRMSDFEQILSSGGSAASCCSTAWSPPQARPALDSLMGGEGGSQLLQGSPARPASAAATVAEPEDGGGGLSAAASLDGTGGGGGAEAWASSPSGVPAGLGGSSAQGAAGVQPGSLSLAADAEAASAREQRRAEPPPAPEAQAAWGAALSPRNSLRSLDVTIPPARSLSENAAAAAPLPPTPDRSGATAVAPGNVPPSGATTPVAPALAPAPAPTAPAGTQPFGLQPTAVLAGGAATPPGSTARAGLMWVAVGGAPLVAPPGGACGPGSPRRRQSSVPPGGGGGGTAVAIPAPTGPLPAPVSSSASRAHSPSGTGSALPGVLASAPRIHRSSRAQLVTKGAGQGPPSMQLWPAQVLRPAALASQTRYSPQSSVRPVVSSSPPPPSTLGAGGTTPVPSGPSCLPSGTLSVGTPLGPANRPCGASGSGTPSAPPYNWAYKAGVASTAAKVGATEHGGRSSAMTAKARALSMG